MTGWTILTRYAGFAVLAVVANLGVQRVVLWGSDAATVGAARFAAAMLAGTLVGLVVKYLLDKRWIFYDQTTGMRAQGAQFFLYALMGVATTLIFWVTETAFWLIWQTDPAREAGAVLGLTVGYVTKYVLDRRFVFNREAAA
jgi:putative flippase GtrA